jgi:hypothetical protein
MSIESDIQAIRNTLNTKYDKTGGHISGHVSIAGSLSVAGTMSAPRVIGAKWNANDLAELFAAGIDIPVGYIVMLDLDSEEETYTIATKGKGPLVGVVSDEYGFLLGGEPRPGFVPISLAGRVNVYVHGTVKAGQAVGLSDIPGIGIAADINDDIIGVAVETKKTEGIGKVRIKVK